MILEISSIKNKITSYLAQPYPFYLQGKELAIIACFLFFMTLFFNYIFEPFEVYVPEHKMDFFWISAIHASTPLVLILLATSIKISPETEENWNIGKEILTVAIFLLCVGIAQFLIRDIIYDNPNNWSLRYLFEEIRNTFLIGTLFAILLISLNFNRLNTRNSINAKVLNSSPTFSKRSITSKILIETQVKSDAIELDIQQFIFAKADGNYVEIYLQSEKTIKVLKRISLSELETILKPYSNIIRTHRSYLVNLNYLKNVTGNAQGYKLSLQYCDNKIPVSRNKLHHFDQKMKND